MFSDFFETLKSKIAYMSEHKHRHDRNIYDVFKGVIRTRKGVAAFLTLVFSLTVSVSYASPQNYEIAIIDGDNYYELMSPSTTVAQVLANADIKLSKYDIVSPELDNYIKGSQTIVVERVNKVTVADNGEVNTYYTTVDTVGEFLKEKGIDVNYRDTVSLPLEEKLTADTQLEIVRIVKHIVKVDTVIPYETKTLADTSMSISDTRLVSPGVNGIECQTYEVITRNGVEVERTLVSSERTAEPVAEVKAVGTKGGKMPKADDFSYSKLITCTATAYDLSFQSCGKRPGDRGYGITASGTQARYGTVAVDPRVIPLGTRMYIESADGSFVYGYCIAEDTGGAIKGNKVDLFFNTNAECMQFGRRSVNVYILD